MLPGGVEHLQMLAEMSLDTGAPLVYSCIEDTRHGEPFVWFDLISFPPRYGGGFTLIGTPIEELSCEYCGRPMWDGTGCTRNWCCLGEYPSTRAWCADGCEGREFRQQEEQ